MSLNNHHHTQNLILNTTSAGPACISTSTISTNTTNGPVATANIMDNSMGQMTPMANNGQLVLSQSMDSVNTASNEEEVSLTFF